MKKINFRELYPDVYTTDFFVDVTEEVIETSREWDAKRQQRLDVDEHCCAMCGRPETKCRNGLQVHHITYQRLGHEDIYNDLVSLCPGCHKKIHSYYRRRRHGYAN